VEWLWCMRAKRSWYAAVSKSATSNGSSFRIKKWHSKGRATYSLIHISPCPTNFRPLPFGLKHMHIYVYILKHITFIDGAALYIYIYSYSYIYFFFTYIYTFIYIYFPYIYIYMCICTYRQVVGSSVVQIFNYSILILPARVTPTSPHRQTL
jgi:hypothetical protein